MANKRISFGDWKARVLAIAADLRAGIPVAKARRHGYNIERFSRDLIAAIIADPSRVPTEAEYQEYFKRQFAVTHPRDIAKRTPEVDAVPDEKITTASRKPKGVSDVRWRIELRRRRAHEYFDLCDPT